ncbi:hypothetical protein PIB30_015920 [Stylosanthes scabra]|uniref:Uncharacterized protein n=1 Tax=Stylosanthes scabra TaxID=79078 RepID=A0ABU6U8R6_9FABA|nr:hypothetical protein [Stylosanthes scabra]
MVGEANSIFEEKMKNPTNSGASSHGGASRRKLKRHHYNSGRCYHGLEAAVLKSQTAENPNRWFLRCPHYKGHWLLFPQGADAYIDELVSVIPIADGSIRTALNTDCGIASWGAYI